MTITITITITVTTTITITITMFKIKNLSPSLYFAAKDPVLIPALKSPSSALMSAPLKVLIMSKVSIFTALQFFFIGFVLFFHVGFFFLFFRIAENDFFKQDWRARKKAQIFQYIFMKWSLCFLIGLIVGLIGFFNNLAVENIAGIKFVVTSNMMLASK